MTENQSRKKPEKALIAQINVELAEKFQSQLAKRKQMQKYAMTAAIKLWIELPVDVQARLLDESMDANSFVELVRGITDERIAAAASAGQTPAPAARRQPTETQISQSIDNIRYFVTYKLPSPEIRKELENLRRMLGAEEKLAGKKTKRA
jgi:hypothetical protein